MLNLLRPTSAFDIFSTFFSFSSVCLFHRHLAQRARSALPLSCKHYSSWFVMIFHPLHKNQKKSSLPFATCMRFLNRLPEYVLAIQHVQNRESRRCYCSLSALKRRYCSRFLSCFCSILSLDALRFQGDWISIRMKNVAKMYIVLIIHATHL